MKRKWADRMMLKHWVFVGLGFCIGRGLFAAEIDSTELNSGRRLLKTAENFRTLSKEPVPEAKTTVFGELFRYQLSTGSNVLPFSMVGKMAFGGYIGSDITANIESKLKEKNRAGLYQSIGLGIYPLMSRFDDGVRGSAVGVSKARTSPRKLSAIGIRNVQTAGLQFTDDAFRLVFRGNGYYKGKELAVGENFIQNLGYNSVDFLWAGSTSRVTVSVLQVTSFSRIQTGDMKLFTSALGDSLAFNGRYLSATTANLGWGSKGMGIAISMDKLISFRGFGSYKGSGKLHHLGLGVRDFGVIQLPMVSVESRGYVWDASGKGLNPVGDAITQAVTLKQAVVNARQLQLSNWFGNQRDSALARLDLSNQNRSGAILAPFTLYAELNRFYCLGQTLGMNVTYLHVKGYVPSARVWLNFDWNAKGNQKWTSLQMQPYFALGGFDTWDLGIFTTFQTPIKRLGNTSFRLDLRGLEAWAMPNKQHGAGLSAAVLFRL